IWLAIIEVLSRTFFPTAGMITWQQKAATAVQIGFFALYIGVTWLARKFPTNQVLRFLSWPGTFWMIFMSNSLNGFMSRPGVSGYFFYSFVVFCGGITFAIIFFKYSSPQAPRTVRALCTVLSALISLGLVESFGRRQFRSIPRTFCGGQPDLAWLRLA